MLLRSGKRKWQAPIHGGCDDDESDARADRSKKRRVLLPPSATYFKENQAVASIDQARREPVCDQPTSRFRSPRLPKSAEQNPCPIPPNQWEGPPTDKSNHNRATLISADAIKFPEAETKRLRLTPQGVAVDCEEPLRVPSSRNSNSNGDNTVHPVRHWVETQRWPTSPATMSQEKSESSNKRSRSASYSQSAKEGDVPRAYSPAFEAILANNGVFMEEIKGRSLVSLESKKLYTKLLQGRYPDPEHTAFSLSNFMLVWQRAQPRNEGRVYRDLTSLLVPSPELLCINGAQQLDGITEEISVEWSKCKTLGGPKPKPDFAAGISAQAFDDEQLAKLRNYTSYERPTVFTDNMYFPFLLCEVKCGNEAINRADRQNMHSSSMAVKAVVELIRSLGDEDMVHGLNGQTLALSVSHDNERVKIYAHFAVTTDDRTRFYRYPVASSVLNFDEDQGWKKTRDIVMGIYHIFYPEHLRRIRDALARMDDPRKQSMYSDMSVEEDESEAEPSAQSSQETTAFKKPNVPASKKQRGELSLLRDLLAKQELQIQQGQEQMEAQRQQSQQQLEFLQQQLKQSQEQMEAQRKQSQEQMEAQRKQSQEQVEMLRQLLGRR